MESKIMNYQAIITDIKDIISSGQKNSIHCHQQSNDTNILACG